MAKKKYSEKRLREQMSNTRRSIKIRRHRIPGKEPFCMLIIEHLMHFVLIERAIPIIAPDGTMVKICFPGGTQWHAWGPKKSMLREAKEEVTLEIEIDEMYGPFTHPLSGKETFIGRGRPKHPLRSGGLPPLTPGRNVVRAWWATAEEVARQTSSPLTPIVMTWMGLTPEMVRAIRAGETG